jgi:hypothetical protein
MDTIEGLREFRNSLVMLCGKYNHSSAPYVLRTDHEHERARAIARECLRRINRRFIENVHYKELSNGALWPIR